MNDLIKKDQKQLLKDSSKIIKKRSVAGVIAYTARTFFLQIIALIATLFLAAFLEPGEFGTFFLVSSLVNLFVFLSDIGLAASLIQKKQTPSRNDLKTTFTVQQLLALLIFSLIIFLTPIWKSQFSLNPEGIMLLYALGFSFILSSLKTIPSILLERQLKFNKLILPQIVENIFFYSTAVILAWKGYGITSYTLAVLFRGISGVITIYIIKPWQPSIGISRTSLKGLLKFGFPFQINDLLARIKDDLLIVVVKKFITAAELGYVGWAQRWSLFPFRFTVDSVIRVTFPAYSRLQHDKQQLKIAIEKSIFFITLIIFPLLFGMVAMARPLTEVVENYHKWQPALPALYLFIINVLWSSISTPLTNAINAIGKITITLRLMIFWTSLTWLLTIPLVIKLGFIGVALASAIVASTSVITIIVVKRIIDIKVLKNILPQLISAIIMLAALLFVRGIINQSVLRFILVIISGGLIYITSTLLIMPRKLISEVKKIIELKRA